MKKKLKSLLKKNESIFKDPYELLSNISKFRYTEFTNLMSPLEVLLTQQGSCHDQTMFEFTELTDMGLSPKAKFIMAVDENNKGLETHSFVYYEIDGKFHWFESAWKEMQGIHQFDDYYTMIAYVAKNFKSRNNSNMLYISDFNPEEHTIGESLTRLVDTCMATAKPLI